ncbi:MAG: hypothetical protein WKF48_05885 [Solirubrobacteraceae bacterium]
MSALLTAVQAERDALLAPIADRLAMLDDIERLAAALDTAAPPKPKHGVPAPAARPSAAATAARTPKPPSKRGGAAARVGRDGLGPKAASLLEAIRSQSGWLSRAEIVKLGGEFAGHTMASLVDRELVEAKGATSQRRYRAANPDNPSAGGGSGGSTMPAVAHPPAAAAAPAAAGTLDGVARRVLQARILDHLSRRRLDEQSLASALNADREHVAEILGKLRFDDRVVLDPDGRYRVPA